MEKRCRVCGKTKPLDDFYRMAGMRDGYRSECKRCNLDARAERYRANPEKEIERVRAWQRANPDKVRAADERARQSGRKQLSNRRSHLKRKFGLTLEDYERMLEAQGGGCFICGTPPPDGGSLHVDHDHETGTVRGLLCFTHNNALGDFDDDPALLRAALRYLHDHDPEVHEARALARARLDALVGAGG